MKKIYWFFWWLWNYPEIVWMKLKFNIRKWKKHKKENEQ